MARIYGNQWANWLFGTLQNDLIFGFGGNDTILSGDGDDTVYGGFGNDVIYTGQGQDRYYGDAGNDTFYVLDRTTGDRDTIDGGTGWDVVDFGLSTEGITTRYLPVSITNVEELRFTDHQDIVEMWTGFVDDALKLVDLGGGNDYFSGSGNGMTVNGGTGNDFISLAGNSTMNGGDGNDVLRGGEGVGHMTGGNGADRFVFQRFDNTHSHSELWGVVTDFNASEGDTLQISDPFWQDLTYIGGRAFEGDGQGQVRMVRDFFNNPLQAVIYVDLEGDGQSDGRIVLNLEHWLAAPTAEDFIL